MQENIDMHQAGYKKRNSRCQWSIFNLKNAWKDYNHRYDELIGANL